MSSLQEKVDTNTANLCKALEGVNEVQVQFKPTPNEWSVLECLEHIYLIDRAVLKTLSVIATTNDGLNDKTELFGESKLNHLLVNKRDFKVQAPEPFKPTGKLNSLRDAVEAIEQVKNGLVDYISNTPFSQNTQTFKHPFLGDMTATDWIYFFISHTQRHIHQIEQIKAQSGFPA